MAENLAELQRWFQNALLSDRRPSAEPLTGTAGFSSGERLALYRFGYRARLLECMRGLHPALAGLLGREAFDGFAWDYLDRHPSRSRLLARLDGEFVAHLQRTRPDAGLPDGQREFWYQLIVDLARLECAWTEMLDGTGERLLLTVCAPVHHCLAAALRGETPELPVPARTRLVLTRRDHRVVIRQVEPAKPMPC